VFTNTIEGFWSLIKRAWCGSHHHCSNREMSLYVGEACGKHNHRKSLDHGFNAFLEGCFAQRKNADDNGTP